jgi:putative transcriptional regulator
MKNRLKVLRAERDFTQQDLAERIGVSRQTINAIEKGKYDPSLPVAFRLGATFFCRIEDIFQPEQEEHTHATF